MKTKLVSFAVLAALYGTAAQADFTFARSKSAGIEVIVQGEGVNKNNWCAAEVDVRFAPMPGKKQVNLGDAETIMAKLGTLIQKQCPSAKKVDVTIADGSGKVVKSAVSLAQEGWRLAYVDLPEQHNSSDGAVKKEAIVQAKKASATPQVAEKKKSQAPVYKHPRSKRDWFNYAAYLLSQGIPLNEDLSLDESRDIYYTAYAYIKENEKGGYFRVRKMGNNEIYRAEVIEKYKPAADALIQEIKESGGRFTDNSGTIMLSLGEYDLKKGEFVPRLGRDSVFDFAPLHSSKTNPLISAERFTTGGYWGGLPGFSPRNAGVSYRYEDFVLPAWKMPRNEASRLINNSGSHRSLPVVLHVEAHPTEDKKPGNVIVKIVQVDVYADRKHKKLLKRFTEADLEQAAERHLAEVKAMEEAKRKAEEARRQAQIKAQQERERKRYEYAMKEYERDLQESVESRVEQMIDEIKRHAIDPVDIALMLDGTQGIKKSYVTSMMDDPSKEGAVLIKVDDDQLLWPVKGLKVAGEDDREGWIVAQARYDDQGQRLEIKRIIATCEDAKCSDLYNDIERLKPALKKAAYQEVKKYLVKPRMPDFMKEEMQDKQGEDK